MKTNIVVYISPSIRYLTKFWFSVLWDKKMLVNQIAGFFKI